MGVVNLEDAPREDYYWLVRDEMERALQGTMFQVALYDRENPIDEDLPYERDQPLHLREAEFLWSEIRSYFPGFDEFFRPVFSAHCGCGGDIYQVYCLVAPPDMRAEIREGVSIG